jgi:hypothetical protein
MNFIDPNKQYRLMLPVFNQLAVKLWRRPENCAVNKMLEDFLDEFDPERAKPSSFEPKTKAG